MDLADLRIDLLQLLDRHVRQLGVLLGRARSDQSIITITVHSLGLLVKVITGDVIVEHEGLA